MKPIIFSMALILFTGICHSYAQHISREKPVSDTAATLPRPGIKLNGRIDMKVIAAPSSGSKAEISTGTEGKTKTVTIQKALPATFKSRGATVAPEQ